MFPIILLCFVKVLGAQEFPKGGVDTPRIVGGGQALDGQFPWMVALFYKGKYFCSASLISDRMVLTAAHCLVFKNNTEKNPKDVVGHVGSANKSRPRLTLKFESLYVYPGYDPDDGPQHDLAVLFTISSVSEDEYVRPICLSTGQGEKRYGKVLAMGWGDTKNIMTAGCDTRQVVSPVSEILHYSGLKVLRYSKCPKIDKKSKAFFMCAGEHLGINRGVCKGDSGGPLVATHRKTKKPFAVGVASYLDLHIGCGSPTAYVRVSYYHNFIETLQEDYNTTACFV